MINIGLYRHYEGDYAFLIDKVILEYNECYIMLNLRTGNKIIAYASEFDEDVTENVENTTGQKRRFERVTDFNNQLNMITTDNLIKELQKRDDNPLAGLDIDEYKNDKEYTHEFVAGRLLVTDSDEYGVVERFEPVYSAGTLEKAKDWVARNKKKGHVIMKRVLLRTED